MEELRILLKKINEFEYKKITEEEKKDQLSKLWEKVWEKANEPAFPMLEVYDTYLCNENTFIIDQPPILKSIDSEKVKEAIFHLKKNHYLTQEEVYLLLDWNIRNARQNIQKLGFFIEDSSLNGYCELGQALTIMPFEKLGLKVTKNIAKICFFYPDNHVFGTVTFPVLLEKVVSQTYLIDITYRQFFTTTRCHKGMYNTNGIFDIPTTPAPGYFVKDIAFARQLMANGYILLTKQNAKKYGEPFYQSSLKKDEILNFQGDYLKNILEQTGNYTMTDIEDFTMDFPGEKTKKI